MACYIAFPIEGNMSEDAWEINGLAPNVIEGSNGAYYDCGGFYSYSKEFNGTYYWVGYSDALDAYEYTDNIGELWAHNNDDHYTDWHNSSFAGKRVWTNASFNTWDPDFGPDKDALGIPIIFFDGLVEIPESEPTVTYHYILYVKNNADNSAMSGVIVKVYSDMSMSSLILTTSTDPNGRCYFTSSNRDIYVHVEKPGFEYADNGDFPMRGNTTLESAARGAHTAKLKSNTVYNDYYYVVTVRDENGRVVSDVKCEFCSDFSYSSAWGRETIPVNQSDAKDSVFRLVRNIIADELNIDAFDIRYDDKFRQDLGVDSLNSLSITRMVKDYFDVDVNTSEYNNIKTVEELVDYIQDYSTTTIEKSVYTTGSDGLIHNVKVSSTSTPPTIYARLFYLPDNCEPGTPSYGSVDPSRSEFTPNLTLRVSSQTYVDDYYYNVRLIDEKTRRPISGAVVKYMDSTTNVIEEQTTGADGLASYYSNTEILNGVFISVYKDEYLTYEFKQCANTTSETAYVDHFISPKNSLQVLYADDDSPAERINVNIYKYDESNRYINLGTYKTYSNGYIDTLKQSLYTSGDVIHAAVINYSVTPENKPKLKATLVPGSVVIRIPRREESSSWDENEFSTFNNVSANSIKKNITAGNIELKSYPDSDKVTYNSDDFRINIIDPDTINVYDIFSSTPVMIYNNQKNVIGSVDIDLKPDANDLCLKMINRYSGYYNPIFKDILFYNNINVVKDGEVITCPYSNGTFDYEYKDSQGGFGIINNMWFHKANDNKDVDFIDTLTPYYPLTGQYALDYRDYNIFSSSWDNHYYTRQIGLHNSRTCQNIASMNEGLCMFGSKYLNVPETIEIYGLTLGDDANWKGEWNDEWITNPNGCPGEVMFKEVNDNSVDFYFFFKKRILRYFYDHLKDEFEKYIDEKQFSYGKEGLEDDIEEYVSRNVLKLYKLEKVRIFVRRTKMGIHNSRIENDYTKYLEYDKTAEDPTEKAYFNDHTYVEYFRNHGFVEVDNATMTKMNRDDFDRKLVYNLRTGTREEFGFSFILRKI